MTDHSGPSEAALKLLLPLFGGGVTPAQLAGLSRLWRLSAGLTGAGRAYLLATVFHETARSMAPIREWGRGKGRAYGQIDLSGKAPYGRGYVQITWRENYLRADRELRLGGRLAADYDLALDADIAGEILLKGMEQGWFTGKKLADYLQGDQAGLAQYIAARRIINGRDRAADIAGYALQFEAALREERRIGRAPRAPQAERKPPAQSQPLAAKTALGRMLQALARWHPSRG